MEVIVVKNLTKQYGTHLAVDNLSFQVKKGEVFGLLGANGAEYTFLDHSFGALCTIAICAGGVMGLPLVISDCGEISDYLSLDIY